MVEKQNNAAAAAIDLLIRDTDGKTDSKCVLCDSSAAIENGNEIYHSTSGHIICVKCGESIDKVIADLASGKTELPEGYYYGDCPKWGIAEKRLNVARSHFMVCHTHKLFWSIGSKQFSDYLDETEDIWERNVEVLSQYREVECWNRWLAEQKRRDERNERVKGVLLKKIFGAQT
jgi:hypothetical protein